MTTKGKSQQVAAALRGGIVDGKWSPGEKLPSERELAVSMGVNRNSVREALASLKVSGYITTKLGEGSFVELAAPTTEDDESFLAALSVADSLELREALDVAAISLAIGRARSADILRIEHVVQRLEELVSEGRFNDYLHGTLDLHLAIAKASHSEVLIKMLTDLIEKRRDDQWVLARRYDENVGAHSLSIHRSLAKAVVERNYAAGARANAQHYDAYPFSVNSTAESTALIVPK